MKAMLRTRFISLSLLSALVLFCTINNDVSARGLGRIKQTTATVAAEVINCRLEEGWCSKDSYVLITGDDPAYSILSINGSYNGKGFQYDGKTCSIPLNVGANNLTFWSVSSSGLTSEKKYLTINLTANQTHLLINFDLTKKTEASLLPGRQLLVDVGNDLKDVRFMNPTGSPFDNANYPAGTLSSIDTSSSPLTEADKLESQSNNHQWILIAKGSLLPFQFNSDEKNNSSDETLTKSKAESPAFRRIHRLPRMP